VFNAQSDQEAGAPGESQKARRAQGREGLDGSRSDSATPVVQVQNGERTGQNTQEIAIVGKGQGTRSGSEEGQTEKGCQQKGGHQKKSRAEEENSGETQKSAEEKNSQKKALEQPGREQSCLWKNPP